MLTTELLNANTALKELTDAQREAIISLSKNDENTVIGSKLSELYTKLDATIEKSTGIKREGAEKTYNYLERAALKLKDSTKDLDTYKAKVTDLEANKLKLESELKNASGDETLKGKITQYETDLQKAKDDYKTLKAESEEAKGNYTKEMFNFKVDSELNNAINGIKFNDDMNDSAKKIIIDSVSNGLKTKYTPVFGEDGKVTYKDKEGAILTNKENGLEPFTTNELLSREFKTMGVLKDVVPQGGVGGKGTPPKGGAAISIGNATTRVDAVDNIRNSLFEQGLTVGSDEFADAELAAYKDNNVSSLPEQ